jgi:mono/diheme cytochrome c family protein
MLYMQSCSVCHGPAGDGSGALPDLAYSSEGMHRMFKDIILKGVLLAKGMTA